MPLPPGTLKALTGHVDAVAVVVLFCLAMGALVEHAEPWPVVAGLALALSIFAFLRRAEYRSKERVAELKVRQAAVRAEEARARYRAARGAKQASVELEPPAETVDMTSPTPGKDST